MTDKLLLDTNAVIYALQGALHINELLERRNLHLSFITEIELYSWPVLKPDDQRLIRNFISSCQILESSFPLKKRVIEIRKNYKLKMADAFIAATAIQYDIPLVSADVVFNKVTGINFIKINL